MAKKDMFTRSWIIEKSIEIISNYSPGELTIRALHYQLVGIGMTNTDRHYKRVVSAMIQARWDGEVAFDTFSDHERGMLCNTPYQETNVDDEIEESKSWINYYVRNFFKNKWENQPYYVEVFIEKKALQGVFQPVCDEVGVYLGACKGYPSLTFLYEAAARFAKAQSNGMKPVIMYFGDHDPSGEDIPRSIEENLYKMGVEVEVRRKALMKEQVLAWDLPPAPVKSGDSRAAKWDGLGQVELDAVDIEILRDLVRESIDDVFDKDVYRELIEQQKKEREYYKGEMREFMNNYEF